MLRVLLCWQNAVYGYPAFFLFTSWWMSALLLGTFAHSSLCKLVLFAFSVGVDMLGQW